MVRGNLDFWSLAALEAQLDQLDYAATDDLGIDLRRVSDVDGEVIKVLENFAKATVKSGRRLSILCEPGPVAGWLYAAGLDPLV